MMVLTKKNDKDKNDNDNSNNGYLYSLLKVFFLSLNYNSLLANTTYRSSRPEVYLRKGVLKICSKFTEEHPC